MLYIFFQVRYLFLSSVFLSVLFAHMHIYRMHVYPACVSLTPHSPHNWVVGHILSWCPISVVLSMFLASCTRQA